MLAAMLAAAAVCGPPGAATLAHSDLARVYVTRGAARACVRARRGSWRLGEAARVLETRVAGRFALLRRPGERLTVYDLRRRRRAGSAGSFSGDVMFMKVRLYRSGIAAYAARTPGGRVIINTTAGAWGADGPDISPGFVAMSGYVLAWWRDGGLEVQLEDGYPALPRRPLRRGRITVGTDGEDGLRARLRGRRPVRLGEAMFPCISPGGCSGVDRLQLAGDHVAARYRSADHINQQYEGLLMVADLRARTCRTACRSSEVHEYVLTDDGAIDCLVDAGESPFTQEVRSEGAVLDAGTGISDLRRRGDDLVWLHDGAERSAPLPPPG